MSAGDRIALPQASGSSPSSSGAASVVVADDLPSAVLEPLRALGWDVQELAGASSAALRAALANAEALIVRSATKVDDALLAAAPHLRVVARAGSGVDTIDVQAASARGILVLNAPGANSVSVAEHAMALMLALSRGITTADAAMKAQRWEKKQLVGAELRGKTLGIIGLGRVGREVARRARVFGMSILAYDPFIAAHIVSDLDVGLKPLDEICSRADYLTLHLPATAESRRLLDAARLAKCKPGVRIINTARGELIDEEALLEALTSGHVGGAALDVFEVEPPRDWRLIAHPRVVATPHIAASTVEAQEQVGFEAVAAVIDYLRDGAVRNAVNFPAMPPDEYARLRPYAILCERLGSLVAQLATGRLERIGIRYYGALASTGGTEILLSSVLAGLLNQILSSRVTLVNARTVAADRGLDVIESRSPRPRDFTSLVSVKLHTSDGELWVEGAVFEHGGPRLVLFDGIDIEAPLAGTLLVMRNHDQPGVIGDIGSILGRHRINIASFALGRSELGDPGAVGVIAVDANREGFAADSEAALREVRSLAAIQRADFVRM